MAADRAHRPQRGHRARRRRGRSAASCSSGCSSTSASSIPASTAAGSSLVAIVSALLIAATVHPASKLVPWLLGFAVFRWIGVRSYGIYLWHWPIYMVTRPHSDVPITGLPLLVIRLALTFAAAALSYKYIEEPIRHGAIERRWAQYRAAPAETQRKLMARFGSVGAGDHASGSWSSWSGSATAGARPRRRGSATRPQVVLRPGRSHHDHPARRHHDEPHAGHGTTTPRPVRSPPAVTAIGDSVMLGAGEPAEVGTIDTMFATPTVPRDDRRRGREPAVLRRRRPDPGLQGQGAARPGRRRPARHQRHHRPRRVRPHDGDPQPTARRS